MREEEEKGGLVIVGALYGLLVSNRYNIIKNISSSTSHYGIVKLCECATLKR